MKRKNLFLRIFIVAIVATISFSGCKRNLNENSAVDDLAPIIPKTTVVLSANDLQGVEIIDSVTWRIKNTNSKALNTNPLLQTSLGYCVVLPPCEQFPNGFFRKNILLSEQFGYTYYSWGDGSFNEAIEQGNASYKAPIGNNIDKVTDENGMPIAGDFSNGIQIPMNTEFEIEKNVSVKLTGEGSVNYDFSFDMAFKNFTLQKLSYKITSTDKLKLAVEFTGTATGKIYKKTLRRILLKPILIMVGNIPVVLNTYFNINLNVNANGTASLNAELINYERTSTRGATFENGSWTQIVVNPQITTAPPTLDLEFTGELTAGLQAELEIRFYDLKNCNTKGKLGLYGKLKGTANTSTVDLALNLALEGELSVFTKIYSATLVDYKATFNLAEWKIKEWSYKPQIPVNGLIAYYPLDDNVKDSSGSNLNGTIIGSIQSTTDRKGALNSAYYFDGTVFNYISVADNAKLNMNVFTISAWIYRTAVTDGGYIVNKGRDVENGHYGLLSSSIGAETNYYGINGASFANEDFGIWQLITGTVSGNSAKFYINGKLVSSATLSTSFACNSGGQPLTIGNHYYVGVPPEWAYPFKGKIDDVRIYNRALSDSEVKTLYRP
jgi:hypothetical protein